MDEKNDTEKDIDDFMLPGFRFHPTDEELVGFYLRRKLLQRALPIELIKQVDIYKYDPWDLPKLASTGEKEWYFFCPRDRKYRNSARPNRVTGSGFWKATGTDRPIYSSEGTKCIGLKKSLVFYRGRAAKGIKTDWMMHEFRLPSTTMDGGAPPPPPHKKFSDKSFPATDSWAICRIFKKTNSMAQRAISHTWATSLSETPPIDHHAYTYTTLPNHSHFNSDHNTEIELQRRNFSPLIVKPSIYTSTNVDNYFPVDHIFLPPQEVSGTSNKSTVDFTSMLSDLSSPMLSGGLQSPVQRFNNGFLDVNSQQVMQESLDCEDGQVGLRKNGSATNVHNPWGQIRLIGFPFSLPCGGQDSLKPSNSCLQWDSPSCPSEISSTTYSTEKCYT